VFPVLAFAVAANQAFSAGPPVAVDARDLSRQIDQRIGERLRAEKVQPVPLADDAEFVRRVYLDITGIIPPAEKVAAFLDSKDKDKRGKLIDELLASPQYGRHMADIWQGLLMPRSSDNRRLREEPLFHWLEESFNSNKSWDKLAAELVTSSGTQDDNGAVTFFLANQTADKMTDSVCKLFLGVQLQCAQCHNHPFTGWKQNDYWGMAAFFTKVRSGNIRKAAKQGNTLEVEEGKGRGAKLPTSAKIVPAKFLQGDEPKLDKDAPYRPVLARWLTASENPFFARAMANRLWAHFFGQGIVNPVDDMHEGNVPSHPELLQELAGQFQAHHFDVKYLIRALCNSQAYQRTGKQTGAEDKAGPLFGRMAVKVLTPEQLYDSLVAVIGEPGKQAAQGRKGAQPQPKKGGPNNPRAAFVAFFHTDDGANPTEYQAGIPQALRLMNSPQFSRQAVTLDQAMKSARSPAQIIDQLYLATLARHPTSAESQRLSNYVRAHSADPHKGYGDIFWAVLNSSEFTLNH
jgi:hypothetical protein